MAAPGAGEAMALVAGLAQALNLPAVMFEVVNIMAKEPREFDGGQRKLLITAYKDTFSPKYKNLRVISAMEQDEDQPNHIKCIIVFFRELLENDMQATCKNALNILENYLLKFCHVAENAILYYKMIGDTYWFLAMLKMEEDKEPHVHKALVAYKTASKKAESMSPADPQRLGLDLTKMAFYHDVLNRPQRAIDLGEQALNMARPELVLLDKESHKESTLYMGLIEENLNMWAFKDPGDTTLSFKETLLQTAPSCSTTYPCPVVPISARWSPFDSASGMAAAGAVEAMAIVAVFAHALNLPSVMAEAVNMMAKEHRELDVRQKDLFSTAYKVTFSPKYKNLRVISGMEQDEDHPNHIVFFRELLENEMQAMCMNALDILEKHLLPFCRVAENAALYNKMIGDTYWFLAMLKKEKDKPQLVDNALAAYKTASNRAKSLSPAGPLRLGVEMTKTAFYHDVLNRPKRACTLAKQALDMARPKLALLDKESVPYKVSTLYMGLIEENLKMWARKDPEDTLSFKETLLQTASSSSTGCLCPVPVIPRSGPVVAPDIFISPGDWGHEVHEGLSPIEIQKRKKAAQMKKGRFG